MTPKYKKNEKVMVRKYNSDSYHYGWVKGMTKYQGMIMTIKEISTRNYQMTDKPAYIMIEDGGKWNFAECHLHKLTDDLPDELFTL